MKQTTVWPFSSYVCTQTGVVSNGECKGTGNSKNCNLNATSKLYREWVSKASNASCFDAGGCEPGMGNILVRFNLPKSDADCVRVHPVDPIDQGPPVSQ